MAPATTVPSRPTNLVQTTVGHRRCERCGTNTLQHKGNFVNGTIRPANVCERCKTVTVFGESDEHVPIVVTRYEPRSCVPCSAETFHAVVEQGTALEAPRCVLCRPHPDDAVELKDLSRF